MEIRSVLRRLRICRGSESIVLLAMLVAVIIRNVVLAQDDSGHNEILPYPTYNEVPPNLPFSCADKPPGYYADPDTRCQVWHWCVPSGHKYSFLCPNQTVFNQAYRVCDWFFNVNCPEAVSKYNVNDDLYKDSEGNYIQG